VGDQIEPSAFTEDADVRVISPTRTVDGGYANGYGNSKWAGEVLLREANDLCGLPVSVFRCDMILADTTYAGQLNVPDMFTRLMLSLVATGIAPGSFYELDADGNRQRAHYDGLPVGFIADAISTLGAQVVDGYQTYHVMNPFDDGIGLDEYVDWLIDAGYPIQRIPAFRSAVQEAKIGPDKDIPHISAPIIVKYVTDLQLLGLLSADRQNAVPRHLKPERGEFADPPGALLQASTRRASPLQGTPRHRQLLSLPGLQPIWDVARRSTGARRWRGHRDRFRTTPRQGGQCPCG
jgi:thioester reductase-like protein